MRLEDNLTYEQFMVLAKNPPQWQGETLFRLSIVVIDKRERHRYPRYDVSSYSHGYFHTRQEAEQFMRQNKKGKDKFGNRIFCYYLYEEPFATILNVSDYISCRVYDAQGQLIEQSLCADISFDDDCRMFFGRPADMVRFEEGDIVEVLDLYNDKVSLGVVTHPPTSPERTWRIYSRLSEYAGIYVFDASDDSYAFVYGPSYEYDHDNRSPLYIFAPHFKIPDKIRQCFENYYKLVLKEQEDYAKKEKDKNTI